MNSIVRPMSWRQLLKSGFEMHLYAFEDLPTETQRVVLEQAAWHPLGTRLAPGQRVPAVVWFLRDLESEQRYTSLYSRIGIFIV
jgi:hypothetical protein